MKTLNIEQMTDLQAGGGVSDFITGACIGVGIAGTLKLVAISAPVGGAIFAVCSVNTIGSYLDWW